MPFTGSGTGIQNADDVFFSSVSDGETLQYNFGTAKWNNAPGGMPVKSDKADAPTASLDDPTNDVVGRWDIVDDATPTASWPDRLAFRYEGVRTGSFNEYGEIRVEPAKTNTVAMRAHGHASGSTGPIFQVRASRGGADIFNVETDQIEAFQPITAPNMTGVLALPTGDPVPAGTPAGTTIVRY